MRNGLYHDANAVDVEDLRKAQPLAAHLAVDAVEVFFAAADLRVDTGGCELGAHRLGHSPDHLATIASCCLDGLSQHGMAQRVEILEGQFLEFVKK